MPISYLHHMVNPEMIIPPGAQKVNHIKQEWVDLADVESVVLKEVQTFIRPTDILSGHNIKRYDMHILQRNGITYDNEIMDSLELAKTAGFETGCRSQPYLFEFFFTEEHEARVKAEELAKKNGTEIPGGAHRARQDVLDNRRIILELWDIIEGKPSLF